MRRTCFRPVSANGAHMSAAQGQGSTGNVIAALASFFVPGLGQLIQGRILKALIMFVLAGLLWWFLLGWIIHLWSIIDAALFKRPVG
jgi:TM2 domain-containing membrane protein YozV